MTASARLSPRLAAIVHALPIQPHSRVLEIGCGPGAAARAVAAEELVLQADEEPYDIVFAVHVGALDGRHPQAGQRVLRRIAAATRTQARLFIDGGDPLREIVIPLS